MSMKLKKITLTSGDEIEIADGLTAIVGPNNAGKSQLLRELIQRLEGDPNGHGNPARKVFGNHEIEYSPDISDFIDEFKRRGYERPPGQYPEGRYHKTNYVLPNGTTFSLDDLQGLWGSQGGLGSLAAYFILYLGVENRLSMVGSGAGFNPQRQRPSGSAQLLYLDRELEKRISDIMKRAFNETLTVNRYAMTEISLHMGMVLTEETKPPISDEYLTEISKLPLLQDQGDGIRAFVGMILTIITGQNPLVVIDEPEAFLHPPQAYLLGKFLAEQHNEGTQVLVATHDADFIAGVTSAQATSGDISITRLTRKGATNHAAQLSPSVVSGLYKDPLLKYYPILNGLFSQGVVLCEGDSDCIYYRAVLESLANVDVGTSISAISVHFTHCSGKARLARAVSALRSAKVPVVCAVDIDLLQNEHEFNALVEAFGGNPSDYKPLRNVVVNSVEASNRTVSRATAKAEIDAIFAKKQTQDISNSDAAKIRAYVTPASGWKEFKKYGKGKLLGGSLTAFDTLDTALRGIGIYLAPNGELESFHPEISRDDKAAWLRDVLETERYKDASEPAKFVREIVHAIAAAQ